MMRVRRRFSSPFWLVFSLPLYVGLRLLPGLAASPWSLGIGIAVLIGGCLLIASRRRDRSAWAGPVALGFFSTLLVMTVLREVVLLCARVMFGAAAYAALVGPTAIEVLIVTALFTLAGLVLARRPRLVSVDIPIARLPVPLHGFSIAQISDLHVGPTIRRGFVERLVARVNDLDADLIAVTGDLVDGSGERAWTNEIERLGLTVLKNEHVVLRHDGALLVLAGVDDIGAQHFDPAQRSDPAVALRGAPAGAGAKILLAHQPSSAAAAAKAGFDVQISGHTHGGQFWPWNHFVRFFQPFTAGLYRLKNLRLYVSRGTGYWGPPNRFGVPSEITRIRLVPEPC
jgi:predicted MPP superfamily phosphohydrolase